MIRPEFTTKWLFSIIDYNHWDVMHDGQPIAQVVVNAADRSVTVMSYDNHPACFGLPRTRNYNRMAAWLLRHEQ